MKEPERSELTQ